MVVHRHVFGAEEADFPLMAQAEAQDKFVDEFRFSLSGTSRCHQEASGFKGTVFIQILPARFCAFLQAVFEKRAEGVLAVFGGKDTFQRDFFGLRQGDEQAFDAIFGNLLGYYETLQSVDTKSLTRRKAYVLITQKTTTISDSWLYEICTFKLCFLCDDVLLNKSYSYLIPVLAKVTLVNSSIWLYYF